MARYVALPKPPRAWASATEHGWQDRPTITVHEAENAPQETGLVDALGTPLYRVEDRAPIGFRLRKD